MKKPSNKADIAYLLGKASKHCRAIEEIFECLDSDSEKFYEAMSFIDDSIVQQINKLKDSS